VDDVDDELSPDPILTTCRRSSRTSGDPVTNFKRSNALYRLAMSYNRGLDRDKDGIACENQ
jgi:hypothetical protein